MKFDEKEKTNETKGMLYEAYLNRGLRFDKRKRRASKMELLNLINTENGKGFKFHGLIMDKPRCKDGQIYHWIDNRPVRATTYKGNWTELKQIYAKIETFE